MAKVAIAHTQSAVRRRMRLVLEQSSTHEVVGEADDGRAALRLCLERQPDVVLLDEAIVDPMALQVVQAIGRRRPSTRVVAIVSSDPSANVGDLIRAGARGGLTVEEAGGDELVHAVGAVARGGVWLSPKLAGRVLGSTLKAQLTAREMEVLALVASGLKNAEIAERLTLSKYTVQNHVAAIYDKLGVRDRAEAILYAVQLGLVEVDRSLFRNHEELPWA